MIMFFHLGLRFFATKMLFNGAFDSSSKYKWLFSSCSCSEILFIFVDKPNALWFDKTDTFDFFKIPIRHCVLSCCILLCICSDMKSEIHFSLVVS